MLFADSGSIFAIARHAIRPCFSLVVFSLSPTQPSVNPPSRSAHQHLLAILRRTAARQSLAQGKAFNPNIGPMEDNEAQMPNQQDTAVIKGYTQVLCDRGICSPGLSDMGTYHRISLY
jgi:hypothetical protein